MAHMSRFYPGRHLGIWKKEGNLGKREKEWKQEKYSDQGSILMSANNLYKEEGRPIPSQAKFLCSSEISLLVGTLQDHNLVLTLENLGHVQP